MPDWIARTVPFPVLSGMDAYAPTPHSPGTPRLDSEDCSVLDQCVSGAAQALAYEAFLEVRRMRGIVTHFCVGMRAGTQVASVCYVSLHLSSSSFRRIMPSRGLVE